ncbi:MAG: type II secretion system F family protein, partial [Verrucomicrobiota bacterium]
MANFAYKALNPSGETITGELVVSTKSEAYRELEKRSLHPVSVKEAGDGAKPGKRGKASADDEGLQPQTLKRTQVILFTEELADMLDAGLQLERGLKVMEERQEDPAIKKVSAILREEIREGSQISKALPKASPSFDDLYVNLVAAGEQSGSLPEILRRLAVNLTVMHELQSRVIGAMIYPAFLIGACIILMFVFSTVLMPQLTELLSSSNQQMPIMTRLLINFSEFMSRWWWA